MPPPGLSSPSGDLLCSVLLLLIRRLTRLSPNGVKSKTNSVGNKANEEVMTGADIHQFNISSGLDVL